MNGLYCDFDVDISTIAADNCPAPPPPFVQAGLASTGGTPGPSAGLAQASQASAATSPIELASRSVSSIEVMDFVEKSSCRELLAFIAFSDGKPVSTFPENALAQFYGRNPSKII
jgi:hypothetical protein